MHRAINRRVGIYLPLTPHLLHVSVGPMCRKLSTASARPHLTVPRVVQQTSKVSSPLTPSMVCRSISSTPPALKRRGGASAHLPRPSRPRSASKSGGKKRIIKHGEPGQKAKNQRLLEEGRKKAMEHLAAITPEESAMYQELADEVINTPSGDQELGANQFLRDVDPDDLMRKLGIPDASSGHDNTRDSTARILQYAGKWKKPPTTLTESPFSTRRLPPAARGESYEGKEPRMVELTAPHTPHRSKRKKKEFTYLIRVLNAHGRFHEARRRVVPEMLKRGVELDIFTYTALMSGAAMEKDVGAAEEAWAAMLADGIKPNEHAWSTRIHAYTSAGRVHEAIELGDEMREEGIPWGVVVYTSVIAGFVQIRDFNRAWKTYKEMIMWGVQPDVMTYTTIMKMCAHKHEYERAMKFAREMEEMDNIKPTLATMEILLRAAAKAPQWIQAYGDVVDELVIRMKGLGLQPQEHTYRAMMFAYGSGGDADRVLQCIDEVHELENQDVKLLGDGRPKLSPPTYCAALNALASCQSVGMRDGTKARWGSLVDQVVPDLDITPLDVPAEDAKHLKLLKLQAIEWDEEAEARRRKGQTRFKFRGVTTPKELQNDEDWERAVEVEHRKVMQKAKQLKLDKEREEALKLGIDIEEPHRVKRLRLFPHPREKEIMKRDIAKWVQESGDIPGLPEEIRRLPPALRLINPSMDTFESLRKKQVQDDAVLGTGVRNNVSAFLDTGDTAGSEAGRQSSQDRMADSQQAYIRQPLMSGDRVEEDEGGWGDMSKSGSREIPPVSGTADELMELLSRGGVEETANRRDGQDDGAPRLHNETELDWREQQQAFRGMGLGDEEERGSDEEEEGLEMSREVRIRPRDSVDESSLPEIIFPPGFDTLMSDMRSVAEASIRTKKDYHPHLDHDDEGDAMEEEEADDELDEAEEVEDWEGLYEEGARSTRDGLINGVDDGQPATIEPVAEAKATLEQILSEAGAASDRVAPSGVHGLGPRVQGTSELAMTTMESAVFDPSASGAEAEEGDSWLSPSVDEDDVQEDWTPLMHSPITERNLVILETVKALTEDAMAAARSADAAAGFLDPEKAGPAVQATMHARLRNLTEARLWRKAMAFVEEAYPAEGAQVDVKSATAVVEMFCKLRGRRVTDAAAFEERCRKDFGLRPNRRMLGAILAAWAKRHDRSEIKKSLDLMQELGVKPRERDLKFVRMLVDKGKFNHPWLPPDPEINLKKVRAALKNTKTGSRNVRDVVSQIMKSKVLGTGGR